MKRKIIAVLVSCCMACGTLFGLTACNKTGEHEHKWDAGVETTAPTCRSEGVKTFKCTVKGCNESKTEKIGKLDHSWDNGRITKDPTCIAAGEKTFTCTAAGCGATRVDPVEKSEHSWDGGSLTTVPTLSTGGEITYTCEIKDCGKTKTEAVSPRDEFSEQFTTDTSAQTAWSYGYAENYNTETNEFTFTRILAADELAPDTFKAEGAEIKAGWIKSEGNATVAYGFAAAMDADIEIKFNGDEEGTRLSARLVLGKTVISLGTEDSRDWTYTSEEPLSVSAGDTAYLVFFNGSEAEVAASGKLSFKVTTSCVHKLAAQYDTEKHWTECSSCHKHFNEEAHSLGEGSVISEATFTHGGEKLYGCGGCEYSKSEKTDALTTASFVGEFRTQADASSPWKYGYVDYHFPNGEDPNEYFTFKECTKFEDDAWKNDGGTQIKGGWIDCGSMTTIAYTFDGSVTFNASLTFTGGTENTRLALRIAVLNSTGERTYFHFFNSKDINSKDFTVARQGIQVNEGDTIYFIFGNEAWDVEGAYPNGGLALELTK